MLAFEARRLPERCRGGWRAAPAAGFTLFRHTTSGRRVRSASSPTSSSGRRAAGPALAAPELVAADQEGGQFLALGDGSTPFAGNMALGAVDDDGLTERVGRAIGLEARAMGVNVVYAPVLDLATNPANPALGIRRSATTRRVVARHGAAMVRGLQSAGVAATVKHFPGRARRPPTRTTASRPSRASRAVLDAREFVPFRAAVAAGARLAMSAHVALPAVTRIAATLPATLSRAVDDRTCCVRELGFDGVTITDALDMAALAQGADGAPTSSPRSGLASTCC